MVKKLGEKLVEVSKMNEKQEEVSEEEGVEGRKGVKKKGN